ncbi:DnaD domain protein [Hydrogenibacillus schlegelii]|uniref:Uncharacterized protein n=1 Tax=Hydrogenibacillus schlegelii TaxID=1484 RepID=A0A179IU63_HYDSH|nr:DnaD domain protein [Hydrogenibacillus schlegelii]OAR05074.1 hypothetical protein SA87_06100 [Hydrogenibacillus schlegelii]
MASPWARLLQGEILLLPAPFLGRYKALGLRDDDFLLLLHLAALEREGVRFPTPKLLAGRTALDEGAVAARLKALLDAGWLRIDIRFDADGRVVETFNLAPFYERMAAELERLAPAGTVLPEAAGTADRRPAPLLRPAAEGGDADGGALIGRLEAAFGRPLSPMEAELVARWLKDERLSLALIEAAIEEALRFGKNSVRYVDRILFHWAEQGIDTPEAARRYALRFREGRSGERRGDDGPPDPAQGPEGRAPDGRTERRYPQFNWLVYGEEEPFDDADGG